MTIGRRGMLAGGAALLAVPARADTFPSKQIRWVIPFAPGGNYDVTSRLVAEPMGRDLGQTVLIDNKPARAAWSASRSPSTRRPTATPS